MDESGIDESGIDESGAASRSIDESGIDDNGAVPSSIDDKGILDNGIDDSGILDSGIEESGVAPRSIELSGIDDNGIEDRGAPWISRPRTVLPPLQSNSEGTSTHKVVPPRSLSVAEPRASEGRLILDRGDPAMLNCPMLTSANPGGFSASNCLSVTFCVGSSP